MKYLTLIFLLFSLPSFAQQTDIFKIDSLPTEGVLLDKGWKFHAGDDPEWAKADFDDSAWESIDPMKNLHFLPQVEKESVGWLRVHFDVAAAL